MRSCDDDSTNCSPTPLGYARGAVILDLATMIGLAQSCAPGASPRTLLAIAHVESRFDTLAIGINRGGALPAKPVTPSDAARTARELIASGKNIDLGLSQINSANLKWLGLTVDDAFDPCRNLAAAARVLAFNYGAADTGRFDVQSRLRRALSLYNTGDSQRGFYNGYVTRVEAAAAQLTPRIRQISGGPATESKQPPSRSTWDVFAAPSNALVFARPTPNPGASPERSLP